MQPVRKPPRLPSIPLARRVVHTLTHSLLSRAEQQRLRSLHVADAGHGYDVLGMHRAWVTLAAALLGPLHHHYFRVRASGTQHIPQHGPAIFVANHGGILPIDAAMLCMDVLEHTEPPRVLRPVADFFVPELPVVGTLLSRMGAINGARSNVQHVLDAGELVLIFPEGLRAIGKPRDQRYRLQHWSAGHAELALRHGVPIVPVAVIGAEEQWRQLARVELRAFGAPYLPIPWPPLPLPVRYHIHYGEPLRAGRASDHPEPARVDELARASQRAVEALLQEGLRARTGTSR